jgi:hypothetical protein
LISLDLSDDETASAVERIISTPSVPEPPLPSRSRKKSSLTVPIILLLAVLCLSGGVFWYLKSKNSPPMPENAEKTSAVDLKQPAITILDSTQAYFLENSQGGQIFVVEGEVVNESPKPVSFVLLEGKLYTRNNRIAQTQKSFPGNTMSRDELVKMSITDIQNRMMNREGKDLLNVHIPTAKRVPFMLVFHNLPEVDALSDYSVEVISAQFD